MTADSFRHVCNIEKPIRNIRGFLDALALITETLDEPRGAWQSMSSFGQRWVMSRKSMPSM
jgi:hypothetical protein